MRRKIAWGVASLMAAASLASTLTALAQPPVPAPMPRRPGQQRIVTGNDIGFRVEGVDARTGRPTGTFVIRIDGEWVEVGSSPSVRPAY